jgi:hypothetical protein
MRRYRRFGMVVSGAALFFAAAANAAEPASSPAGRLNVWEGNWRYEFDTMQTPLSHAGTLKGVGKCAWLPNHGYMVCDYLRDGVDPAEGVPADNLSILYYSPVEKSFKASTVEHEGAPLPETTKVDGNTWTMT